MSPAIKRVPAPLLYIGNGVKTHLINGDGKPRCQPTTTKPLFRDAPGSPSCKQCHAYWRR